MDPRDRTARRMTIAAMILYIPLTLLIAQFFEWAFG